MVFATGSILNASTNVDEKIRVESIEKIEEEKSCVRGCVDDAISESIYLAETWEVDRMEAYHAVYLLCYDRNC